MTYTPVQLIPPNDEDVTTIVQLLIAGVTGLPGNLVRPRFQGQPPTQPPANTTWCDLFLSQKPASDYPQVVTEADDTTVMHRYEEIDVLCTFYGPQSGFYATTLRDGLYAPNNLEELYKTGLKLLDVGTIIGAPEIVNSQYIGRDDVEVRFVRFVQSLLPITTITSAEVDVLPDQKTTFVVNAADV